MNFQCGNAEKLPYADSLFDMILCFTVFTSIFDKTMKHNIAKDLDYPYNKQKIKEMIAADILSAYYFERGSIENALRTDKQMAEAVKLLKNEAEYRKLLEPNKEDTKTSKAEDKQGKADKKQGKNKKK